MFGKEGGLGMVRHSAVRGEMTKRGCPVSTHQGYRGENQGAKFQRGRGLSR